MKVILKDKVKSLGNVGETVNVSAGYARNFLIPNGFAVQADESSEAQAKHYAKMLAKRVAEEKSDAEAVAKKINGIKIELIKRVGPGGKLFGSVTSQELSVELGKLGHDVERRHLVLANPIKAVGTYAVKAKVFSGVESEFTVTVAMDPKQAEEQEKRAKDIEEAKKIKAAMSAGDSEGAEGEEKKELTEEEKLKIEANKILRS